MRVVDARTAVVTVSGGTGVFAGEELGRLLGQLKADGHVRLVVDLADASWLNSKILDALVRCARDLDPRERAGLAVVTRQQYVQQILEITETGGLLFLADSEEEALAMLP